MDSTKQDILEPHKYLVADYSIDCKEELYTKVFTWLKPGGQVVVSEYAHGRNYPNFTTEYVDYIKDRGYQLVTVQEYGNVLRR